MSQSDTHIHGFERYERAKRYFQDSQYQESAAELEELFTDLAAARTQSEEDASHDPIGHGTAEARLLLTRAYFHSAQLSRAEAAAREVLAEAPDDPYAHLMLGRTLQRAGRPDEARGPLRLAQLLGDYEVPDIPSSKVSDEGL